MPFDTTYHIFSTDSNETETYTKPGGDQQLDIYLKPGELPPGFPNLNIDSLYRSTQHSTSTPVAVPYKPEPYKPGPVFVIIFLAILIFIALMARREAEEINDEPTQPGEDFTNEADDYPNAAVRKAYLTYYGDELNFSNAQYQEILNKHFPYYVALEITDRSKFISRLDKFIHEKTFKIHADTGFKEMPVLISAAAIQLTFGLKNYLLPNFYFIHIFPQEFMRVQPAICFLEGNVSGHSINLSWKHFLEGIQNITDGKNVGLHEMSHALYYQNFVSDENTDRNFKDCFGKFNTDGNKVYNIEKFHETGLYSDYAMTNFQEFWAESVELFFEKPLDMQKDYPDLYVAMSEVLNQDPASKII